MIEVLIKRREAQARYKRTEKGRATERRYRQTESYKKYGMKWRKSYRDRVLAYKIVDKAKKAGKLIEETCEVCGINKNIKAHHVDYLKPLEVQWLCGKHHTAVHSEVFI